MFRDVFDLIVFEICTCVPSYLFLQYFSETDASSILNAQAVEEGMLGLSGCRPRNLRQS